MRIRLTAAAERDVERALAWWRRNRDKAPDALELDLAKALDLIHEQPSAGTPVSNARLSGVRRMNLPRVHYHLYYRVKPNPEPTLYLMAFRHTSRRSVFVREPVPAYYDYAA